MYLYCYVYVFLLLCMLYSVSLCCFVYNLCANMYLQLPPRFNPISVNNIYIYIYIILHDNARPTPLVSYRKQLQRYGGKFFHAPPIALIWHPTTTICSDLWRISFADNVLIQRRQFRKQCVNAFGWLERNFTEGEFSNSQNAGRNVYKEVAIMWKNKERSVD